MSRVIREAAPRFEAEVPLAIVGAGAAGLTAALAAAEEGVEALVLEGDALPRGSTALSAGLIPAAGTRWQAAAGIRDDAALFEADIQAKAKGRALPQLAALLAREAAPALEWLAGTQGLPFSLVDDFDYPGHSRRRMHGLPGRSGAELLDGLRAATERAGLPLLTGARVTALIGDAAGAPHGMEVTRPDGARERIGARAILFACSGYGGDRALVRAHLPRLAQALYFGHPGNTGDAVKWGAGLGARLVQMGAHQGHGNVAHPAGILITWAVIGEGGFQVNAAGRRFWNEAQGYSEAAEAVLAQPGGIAFSVFDARIAAIARQFPDFRAAEAQGAALAAARVEELAARAKLPPAALAASFADVEAMKRARATDALGRDWSRGAPLAAPFHAVRVTGALFHTQGGLLVDEAGRVLSEAGPPIPGLYAAGGAACGVSGPEASGYLSGNGLLSAMVLGRIAGREAARFTRG
ncbi:FAD-dependent oxidoreductase [Rubritepida flocculans]|uniref:FAD-dependent oxidoreductase n=1 Tax=Rubritepida flocculans TaxID=182403 RepID=UPI000480D30E|nr:FAD-dependent oxidoreductase [Rubritepida flocculans]